MSENNVGKPLTRTDGFLKVTGAAQYAAEFQIPGACYGLMVVSEIPKGRIASMDVQQAQSSPGVLAVLTPFNMDRLPEQKVEAPARRMLSLLQDQEVHYNGQPIAVVVAESLEQAREAAIQLRVQYLQVAPDLDFARGLQSATKPATIQGGPTDLVRGDAESVLASSALKVEATYTTPIEHHNPMEPHGTIAHWTGDRLTLYDATQYVTGVKTTVASALGIDAAKVRAICYNTGGGFGSKGSTWSHVVLAAVAARRVGRPVKLILDRNQMFGPVGARPRTSQDVALAASSDGHLLAIKHASSSSTSTIEEWTETSAKVTRMLYPCDHLTSTHRVVAMNIGTPTFTRAPGEASGSFALEVAMDELAYRLSIDPLQLRLSNYALSDPETGLPYSSKALRACYQEAADRFGWADRSPAPQSMRRGKQLVGWGMATATYPTNRSKASARAQLLANGSVLVESGSQDLGTGTYTIMTQVASDALGFPMHRVSFGLGDSSMPQAPVSGGSQSTASVSPAVKAACEDLRSRILQQATADARSSLHGVALSDLDLRDGWVVRVSNPEQRQAPAALIASAPGGALEGNATTAPGEEKKQYAMHAFGAVFVEVLVDPDFGTVRVTRVVGRYGVGRLLNAKTGHSQLMGGVVWGLSMALFEDSILDERYGRMVNNNLSEYHVPVNADIQDIDVAVVEENDLIINPLGAKGIGEIGITGVAAAVSNAVFHATGKRVRDLPISLDKVLEA